MAGRRLFTHSRRQEHIYKKLIAATVQARNGGFVDASVLVG
jgi:hypothetical protein